MNTTAIGTEFEDKVFKYFSSLLNKGEIGFAPPKHSKIFKHKKYPTAYGRDIDFDITIETYNPSVKGEEWSTLAIIECKRYNSIVDVGEIDEFIGKMKDVSDTGVKGIMVTTKGFSQSGIGKARHYHLGLVVFSESNKEWLVSRDQNYTHKNQMPILKGDTQAGMLPLCFYDGSFCSMINMLEKFDVAISDKQSISIPYLKKEEIESKALELYRSTNVVSNDIAYSALSQKYPNIKITFEDLPDGQYGCLSLKDNIITIANEIKNDTHRRNFTLAHELGHLCLHGKVLKNRMSVLKEYDERVVATLPDKIIKRMEVQANHFASYLLMPRRQFDSVVQSIFKELNIRTGRLYLDNQRCNIRDVDYALFLLSSKFNVSRTAAKMRLLNEGLMHDVSISPISQLDFNSF